MKVMDRRPFLRGLGALVLAVPFGCQTRSEGSGAPRTGQPAGSPVITPMQGPKGGCYSLDHGVRVQPVEHLERPCALTAANIEGPYYRAGAPKTGDLRPARADGVPLIVSGRVLSADCRSILSGATIDVWQADATGHYDNDGTMNSEVMRFRGLVETDAQGGFSVTTVIPGRYLNGRKYRPAHIHVKLAARGHHALTTQLYFPDDPFNAEDPFIHPSLVMELEGDTSGKRGSFDFVLQPIA